MGSREELISILMIRDGISRGQAIEQIEECAEALQSGDFSAIQYYLGLEDDYIFAVLGY